METIEEAAKNYNLNTINAFGDYESFIAGAKWQQERSYSEEDLREAFKDAYTLGLEIIYKKSLNKKNVMNGLNYLKINNYGRYN